MKKVSRIVLIIILVVLVLGTFVFLWNKSRPKTVEYETEQVVYKDIEKSTIITGTISPRDEIAIKPQISGIITDIYIEAGDKVKSGDVLAKVKVIPDIAQLNSAESRIKIAEINLEKAKNDFERNNKLYDSKVISKEEIDNYKTIYETAKEELSNAQENISIIKEGISKSTAQYSNTLIKATVSGMVLDVPVKVGNSVIQTNTFNDGTTIATIANMNDLIFMGKVDESEVGKIAVGNKVKLLIGALQNEHLFASLEYIAPKGVSSEGATLFDIKAAVTIDKSSKNFIRSGYSANGEIITEKKEHVLAVPEISVEFEKDSAFIFIENDKQSKEKYTKMAVVLGISDGVYVELLTTVKEGTKIRGKLKSEFNFAK